jgi:methylated-DNA-[protein]-cysteine S-methyltransferase
VDIEQLIKSGRISEKMNFNQKVWAITARVPKGKVVTYGDIARALNTRAYRAVGNALNRNPYAPVVPCHRVVGSDGSLTGFAMGVDKKLQMLTKEGVKFRDANRVDMNSRFKLA